ncbi:kinase-like domain-containing protein [Glomus cerebriforme]|uniref:Kinase-like domain-containing protein n=1 Tax=Glomus cerebriforme TaxID=658196 RepID=A0A397SQS4_9GLOM|nr:kinase-like domain-containing protein [Glomus cerebriforme]
MTKIKKSGNKIIDDFIGYTQMNYISRRGKLEFVPYDQFKNIEFIAEGGFSKIYKATWVDGPIIDAKHNFQNYKVVLKKLNNSKNITSKELNELKVYHDCCKTASIFICEYFGITQDPITQDFMIVMPYYDNGDLINYINNDFFKISWNSKLKKLHNILSGLATLHNADVIHRDLHSGNILFDINIFAIVGDMGLSKSATESTDNNETYGIIPYMAPEIFQKQKYTKASDIYSFGMIMWEFMTGRRPFWDEIHDIELIIKICDGLRPPIVTNAPEGYIELMKDCWDSNPEKRPIASIIFNKFNKIYPTKIIPSSDIGPVKIKNPGAIYESRPLSGMIQSAMSLRSSRSQSINLEIDLFYYYQKNSTTSTDKRKFEGDLIEDSNNNDHDIKRVKLFENKNNGK